MIITQQELIQIERTLRDNIAAQYNNQYETIEQIIEQITDIQFDEEQTAKETIFMILKEDTQIPVIPKSCVEYCKCGTAIDYSDNFYARISDKVIRFCQRSCSLSSLS